MVMFAAVQFVDGAQTNDYGDAGMSLPKTWARIQKQAKWAKRVENSRKNHCQLHQMKIHASSRDLEVLVQTILNYMKINRGKKCLKH